MKIKLYALRAGLLLPVVFAIGCASPRINEPGPRVDIPSADDPRPPPPKLLKEAEAGGQLVTFGKLRTVIQAREQIVDRNGVVSEAREILPALEREFAQRDFRMFSGAIQPDTDIARLTRETRAHLVVNLNARSEFVNSSGAYSKYRAFAEARAIRGRDGTVLAVAQEENVGPRAQNENRAGMLALRELAPALATNLLTELLRKSDQLLWAGLVINGVPTYERAMEIQQAIERERVASFVELLEWDKATQTATYEIIYGAAHESDVGLLLSRITGSKVRVSRYQPGQVESLRKAIQNYK